MNEEQLEPPCAHFCDTRNSEEMCVHCLKAKDTNGPEYKSSLKWFPSLLQMPATIWNKRTCT